MQKTVGERKQRARSNAIERAAARTESILQEAMLWRKLLLLLNVRSLAHAGLERLHSECASTATNIVS